MALNESVKPIAVLFNPSSGRGRSSRIQNRIESLLKSHGIDYRFFVSQSEDHLKQLAAQTVYGYSSIVAVGGDTTFDIIAREILGSSSYTTMGMIGTGSANDIVRAIGVNSIETACRVIKEATTREMDVASLQIKDSSTPIHFLGTLSAGLGVTVNRYVDDFFKRHPRLVRANPAAQSFAGLSGILNSFSQRKIPLTAKIEFQTEGERDTTRKEIQFSLLVVLNTPYYANGLVLSPSAGLFDQCLDLCIIQTSSIFPTLRTAFNVLRGNSSKDPRISCFRSSAFRISTDVPIDIQVDGEIISSVKEFTVSLFHRKLTIYAPIP